MNAKTPPTDFPIVGIGASAGGLAAFEAFFKGMPTDRSPGMAFILVQHLAPDRESMLSTLIRHYTRMQVFDAVDGMVVQRDAIYVIPPDCYLALNGGTLQLSKPEAPRGQRLPVDFLFCSLATALEKRAMGIVLSGTGRDGTLGAQAIKAAGGMVMAQTPESTEFAGMPDSLIATGQANFVLDPQAMAAQLISHTGSQGFASGLPSPTMTAGQAPQTAETLEAIFAILRTQTGHDFSQYKPSTIHRRIERRMAVQKIGTTAQYLKFLEQTPAEAKALFRDFLIGVTNFFRDPEAFRQLEEVVIPGLLNGKPAGATLRIWVVGCSTGEEAYSLAILLQERVDLLKSNFVIQLFATDLDARAIATARAGMYPPEIAEHVSAERLSRYFTFEPEQSAYRVHKTIRDMVVFSEQNVIKDPPFSRLDLITCRNVMIYLSADLQKRLIPLFHYALKPGGMLFLGSSEGVGEFNELFTAIDRKSKIFRRSEEGLSGGRGLLSRLLAPRIHKENMATPNTPRIAMQARQSMRGLTEQALLHQLAPASALVSSLGDILYLYGRTGMYLEPAPGEAGVNNILKMAREGLRRPLTIALHQAGTTHTVIRSPRLSVRTNGHFTTVNLTVCPVPVTTTETPAPYYFLVLMEEAAAHAASGVLPDSAEGGPPPPEVDSSEARIAALKEELRAKEEFLQSTHEELEVSNEELKSSNEEMQSINEELQSSNEELETSKEELQSVNEELGTVNTELQTKVLNLSQANNDMNNLLAGTGIGTVFVDMKLRILRFTPAASDLINLIAGDVGRPVSHIVSNLVGYDSLAADVQSVLDTLTPKEMNVLTNKGKWHTMRILPYRTLDNVIEGAVISFVDISESVRIRDALRKANTLLRLAVVVRDAHDAITVQSLDGMTLAWNPAATRMYGWSEAEALSLNVRDRIPRALQADAAERVEKMRKTEVMEPYLTRRSTRDGRVLEVSVVATALYSDAGAVDAIATTERLVEADTGEHAAPVTS